MGNRELTQSLVVNPIGKAPGINHDDGEKKRWRLTFCCCFDESPNDDDEDDVDCFPRQDKQPVPPQQDISPTGDTLPSLIESTTDTPTDPTDNKNNNEPSDDNIENNNDHPDDDDDDVDCFP